MKIETYLSIFIIGFCYSLLLINKIIFGTLLSLGLLTLIFINKKSLVQDLKTSLKNINKKELLILLLFISCFFISVLNSIKIERSIAVIIYLYLIVFFSFILYLIFIKKKEYADLLFKIFSISLFINCFVITTYNFSHFDFSEMSEVIRFKGYMNIMTLLSFLIFFLSKSKLNIIPLLFLIPNIIISNCNSAILGIIIGSSSCLVFFLYNILKQKKKLRILIISTVFFSFCFSTIFFAQNLPRDHQEKNIQDFQFTIPTELIDPHRQFMWGFSIKKIKIKPLFGYGQDTSNFIKGSQKEIGSPYTGDMNFISSHPHNFIIELLLETGFLGLVSFFFFIFIINYKVWKITKCTTSRLYLIFFNGYFWSTSLVNFSFWLGWWQASYYLILAFIAIKIKVNLFKNTSEKEIKLN